MNETAKDKLCQGLDLLRKGFIKMRDERKNDNQSVEYLEGIETGLKQVEALFSVGSISEAAKLAVKVGNLLATIDFRCALILFRESDKLRRGRVDVLDNQEKEFYKRTAHLLDQAEAHLDAGKIEEARMIMLQYHREKVILGLAGPSF